MDRVYLDSNVLFSAAYDSACMISELWVLPDSELVTSDYAVAEAYRNIADKCPKQLERLGQLLTSMGLVSDLSIRDLPAGIQLPDKDRPILQAAISCAATHLLTGDQHFRPYYGRTIDGTLILRPGDYLRLRKG